MFLIAKINGGNFGNKNYLQQRLKLIASKSSLGKFLHN